MPKSATRDAKPASRLTASRSERGFSLIETMVAVTLLLVVSAGMMEAMLQFSTTQSTVFNRSAMHNGVRSATELLQQEVGQAGHVTLPATVTLSSAVTTAGAQTVTVTSISNMFVGTLTGEGEYLVIDAGDNEETVKVTAINAGANQITAEFANTHATGAPVTVRGGFASGIVPCASGAACPNSTTNVTPFPTFLNGSTGYLLKLYGDINDDGHMVYIEYTCDIDAGLLYRNVTAGAVVATTAPTKAASGPTKILLDNLTDPDSGRVPCFTYQQKTVAGNTFVINVAISLTTQTQFRDRITRQFQKETKSLLNVAPRNVFDAWLLASMGAANRVQPMPTSIRSLLLPAL